MTIKQPVKNTMDRIGLDWTEFDGLEGDIVSVANRFSGESVETSPLVKRCIETIYNISNDYEMGIQSINLSDFDRLRYFVLEADSNAYMACID